MKVLLIAAFLGMALAAPNVPQIKFRNLYNKPLVPVKSTYTGRIINGEVAEPHSIPYQALLHVQNDVSGWYCGGSLISEKVVLTSGNCATNGTSAVITLGAQKPFTVEDSQVVVEALNFIVHPDYVLSSTRNDIAVIKLARPVKLTDAIQLATLPKDDSDNYVGKIAKVSGWGMTDSFGTSLSDVLRYTENPVLTDEECAKFLWSNPEHQLCISGKEDHASCFGDTGGPLTLDGIQIGIASYGVVNCLPNYPSFFTRVSSFLDFIKEASA